MRNSDSEQWKKTFVRLLEKSTLRNQLAETAFELRTANFPVKVFKYRADTSYSRDNLQSSTLWLCSPDDYNDPFDCATKVSLNRVEASLVRGLVRTFFVKQFGLGELDPLPARFEPLIGESNETYLRRVAASYKEFVPAHTFKVEPILAQMAAGLPDFAVEAKQKSNMFRELTKACSFSERNDSILMWSHYAENHQGFCLEYDLSTIADEHPFKKSLLPVLYSKKLYDSTPLVEAWIETPRTSFNPYFPMLPYLHKAEDWSYEREWRLLFVTAKPEPNHSWSAPTPSKVFLGARMSNSANQLIKKLIDGKPIEIHQMRMAEDSFALVSDRIS